MDGLDYHELHCITRARERYSVNLTCFDVDAIRGLIMSGGSLLLRRAPDEAETHVIRFGGIVMLAVWMPDTQRIATFLPKKSAGPEPDPAHKARIKAARLPRWRDKDEQWNERTRSYA